MKKYLIITFVLIMLATLLTAANPWKARLVIINQTKEDIYIRMEYPYTWLTVPYIEPEYKTDKPKTTFTIERAIYKDVEVYACDVIATGNIDLTHNLKLNFTPCEEMFRSDKPRYLGEPSMEKPNWFRAPGMANWQFKYVAPLVAPSNSH